MDWWYKHFVGKAYSGRKNPCVKMVSEIFQYYKSQGIKTEVMAARLRSVDECVHLPGVYFMTININLLDELKAVDYHVDRTLDGKKSKAKSMYLLTCPCLDFTYIAAVIAQNGTAAKQTYGADEARFRLDLFNDHMASDKISQSLRTYPSDGDEMKGILGNMVSSRE